MTFSRNRYPPNNKAWGRLPRNVGTCIWNLQNLATRVESLVLCEAIARNTREFATSVYILQNSHPWPPLFTAYTWTVFDFTNLQFEKPDKQHQNAYIRSSCVKLTWTTTPSLSTFVRIKTKIVNFRTTFTEVVQVKCSRLSFKYRKTKCEYLVNL